MDPKTKNILVEFHKIRSPDGNLISKVSATLHSSGGSLGVEGTVNSYYWRYFFASVLASTAEGYAEAAITRQRDFFGQFQNTPSIENSAKAGVASGASQTANALAERMRNAPEYATISAPITVKIFIIDQFLAKEKI